MKIIVENKSKEELNEIMTRIALILHKENLNYGDCKKVAQAIDKLADVLLERLKAK